jgi:hypothetical protein
MVFIPSCRHFQGYGTAGLARLGAMNKQAMAVATATGQAFESLA